MERYEALKLIETAQALGAAREWDMLDELLYLVDITERRERAACSQMAREWCLVPPDGGSPTPEEVEFCESLAQAIMERK